jgi:HPt (histidine-containing phosphotransfer) domain-containing protein
MSHTAGPREPGASAIVEPPSAQVLDRNVLRDLLESLAQPATVAALYRKFVGNAAAFIHELRAQDNDARMETLHTLKGSAAMMGAGRLAALAMQLQAQSQSSTVQVAQAIQALEAELAEFRVAATAQLLELGASLDNSE